MVDDTPENLYKKCYRRFKLDIFISLKSKMTIMKFHDLSHHWTPKITFFLKMIGCTKPAILIQS